MDRVFIEEQLPVSKLSNESYKERKANLGQTLTGLGKWWGRKPLILARAAIVGLLMPASDNPVRDREIYLKILTMDDDGLWQRKKKSLTPKDIAEHLTPSQKMKYLELSNNKYTWKTNLSNEEKLKAQRMAFDEMPYDKKLTYCYRPEEIEGPSKESWREINEHLGTSATNLQELIQELGMKRFGHIPKVGDCFCGGGSIPFEAARLGCEAYGSDLNPVAALLTWASINIVGGGEEVRKQVKKVQEEAFKKADEQITEWGIEHNERGWRADAYLYCIETKSPSSGYMVPLAPSWVISEKYNVVAKLIPDYENKRFDIEVIENADGDTFKNAKNGTAGNNCLKDPITGDEISISTIRGDRVDSQGRRIYGLRMWENDDIVPRPDDVFQERLYCIRYVDANGKRHYLAPDENDLQREEKVLTLLKERFHDWQERGYIPSKKIDPEGVKTQEPIRNRGWTHWHHLFNPRQLLVNGLLFYYGFSTVVNRSINTSMCLSLGRVANWNSKLCRWLADSANQKGADTFSNQALNTMYNYSVRPITKLNTAWYLIKQTVNNKINIYSKNNAIDARNTNTISDLWITDPPYADAINYHELTEFFLAWYEKHLPELFPDWYTDTKKALAVKGTGNDFKRSMVDIYTNLKNNMPDNGLQLVMFTHQDASVWADLAMILWAAGLKVTAAWTIGTETTSGLKKGNYVQGTVLLVLRKRLEDDSAFMDEIYLEIEDEVKEQLDHMLDLDDESDPNFTDTDYQLAAYAAALRVLTRYEDIEGKDIRNELFRESARGEKSDFEEMIDKAVEIACNYLIPQGIKEDVWKKLLPVERFYLKGLELEMNKEARAGAFQELAKGFAVRNYTQMYASTQANLVRLKTPTEFKRSMMSDDEFGKSVLRNTLFAVHQVTSSEQPQNGLNWLKSELDDYWGVRKIIMEILDYLVKTKNYNHMPHWEADAESAAILKGLIFNDRG